MSTALIGYFILFLVLPPEANIHNTYQIPYYTDNTLILLVLAGYVI